MIKDISTKAADHITTGSYITGGGTTMFGLFGLNDIALAVGIICTVATFVLSHMYRVKHYQLEKARFDREEKTSEE